jgi:hypothetical protein
MEASFILPYCMVAFHRVQSEEWFCIEPLEVSNLSLEIYLEASIVRRIVMFVILEDYLQGFCHGHWVCSRLIRECIYCTYTIPHIQIHILLPWNLKLTLNLKMWWVYECFEYASDAGIKISDDNDLLELV